MQCQGLQTLKGREQSHSNKAGVLEVEGAVWTLGRVRPQASNSEVEGNVGDPVTGTPEVSF